MLRMVEMVIDSVRVSLTNQNRVVVLKEVDSDRYLPIWIGPYEAESITIALQEVEVARPQTHDLLKNVLQSLNARLQRVEVLSLREDVFYGNLVLEVNGRTVEVDCRPSDALALAARAHVSILVAREVLETAGVTPESETTEADAQSKPDAADEVPEPAAEDNLSVFEDFLENLDLDSLDQSDDPDNEPDKH